MECSKLEVAVIEETIGVATADQVRELTEFQLAFVGGGIAELVGC